MRFLEKTSLPLDIRCLAVSIALDRLDIDFLTAHNAMDPVPINDGADRALVTLSYRMRRTQGKVEEPIML